jgi:hypothetical protein
MRVNEAVTKKFEFGVSSAWTSLWGIMEIRNGAGDHRVTGKSTRTGAAIEGK